MPPDDVDVSAKYEDGRITLTVTGYGGAYDAGGQIGNFNCSFEISGDHDLASCYRLARQIAEATNQLRDSIIEDERAGRLSRNAVSGFRDKNGDLPGPFALFLAAKRTTVPPTFHTPLEAKTSKNWYGVLVAAVHASHHIEPVGAGATNVVDAWIAAGVSINGEALAPGEHTKDLNEVPSFTGVGTYHVCVPFHRPPPGWRHVLDVVFE